jgi:hypothetical protein
VQPNKLFQIKPDEYGPDYGDHLFEQYKLYVETTDKVSERRSVANNFFLTANTLLVSIFGIVIGKDALSTTSNGIWLALFAIAGIVFSLAWFFIVKSYRQLNSGKFKVILAIEQNLPLALFKAEWTALGEGHDPKLYRPLTRIEICAPITFAIIYAIILFIGMFYLKI